MEKNFMQLNYDTEKFSVDKNEIVLIFLMLK